MIPIPAKVVRQPNHCPNIRPIGTPNTSAKEVPVANMLSAKARLPSGATRSVIAAVMDQNIACEKAIPTPVSYTHLTLPTICSV